jgi:hypothetical protein
MRIGNAIFWVAVLLALAIHFNALHDPGRMLGLAFIPAVMGFSYRPHTTEAATLHLVVGTGFVMALLRKFIQAAALSALMTGGVYAQVAPLPDNRTPLTNEEKEKKAADDAYRSSLRTIPPTVKAADPWGNVRPTTSSAAKNKQ